MKSYLIPIILIFLIGAGCRHAGVAESAVSPRALVKVVNFRSGELLEDLSFQAQSFYMIRNNINSPVNSYIRKVYINPGDIVSEGQVLFEMMTKEREAVEKSGVLSDPSLKEYGIISIMAASRGIVGSVTGQAGDYIPEGQTLCTISALNSLVFRLQIPFEYNNYVKPGQKCRIETSDGKSYEGLIDKELDQMSLAGQTHQRIIKPLTNEFIPGNLLANIIITVRRVQSNQILPAECLLSDEMMQHFWIMKLINDSVAVRVNVKTGLKTRNEVEVTEPLFSSSDRILSFGHYGLGDTAMIRIEK